MTRPDQAHHLAAATDFAGFFAAARLNPNATLITGLVCGVRALEKVLRG